MTQPTAGWYPDPSDPSRQRYFDGTGWTEHYANAGAPAPFPAQSAKPAQQSGINKKWLIGVGVAAVVTIAIASGGSGSDDKSTTSGTLSTKSSATPAAMPSGPSVAPAGCSVRDGKFEFQVLGVERGETAKEDVFNTERAKGEFFTVKLRVANIGNDARSFSATNQKLIIDGNRYEATAFLDSNSWNEDINPGLGINTEVTFDIPVGAAPSAIECHDSMFSGGARLAL
ncbi:DUF4352 domain-containing protein [Mycobacterium sp. pUA109]|uniref:DUF4352 domain-containing protein n=1 Tax=Mycobacterium sp. pUA109 TaxID=3238982 RepID=UPI00351BB1BC